MPRTEFLIPKSGLRCRDPKTLQLLPPEGALVPLTAYWQRRINDGDVSIGTPPAPAKSAKPAASRGAQE